MKAPRKLHVRKGDKVVVITGAYRSEEAREVLKTFPAAGKVLVRGVNLRWKHQKRSQQNPKGGRVQMEFPIDASNVLLFSDKLERGTRTKSAVVDGKRVRIGVKCGTNFG